LTAAYLRRLLLEDAAKASVHQSRESVA